jgi:3' terminal RNA ribose 2'-O-methyltransferase Hen1
MLLTITYTPHGETDNAADLGWLLHKNPTRPQTVVLSFGNADVFYTEVSKERCTCALLLDIDPLDLARGKEGKNGGYSGLNSNTAGIFDYVNDRPYVSSSFMSSAISIAFGSAMSGRAGNPAGSEQKQSLADSALDFEAKVTMLPCHADKAMLERVFEPLGYTVSYTEYPLDDKHPEWSETSPYDAVRDSAHINPSYRKTGVSPYDKHPEWSETSPYVDLTLHGKVKIQDLLRHLYVLIPVFDLKKHYWMADDEVDKLLGHGKGWLENHPEKEFITRRYFKKAGRLTRIALARIALEKLNENDEENETDTGDDYVDRQSETQVSQLPETEKAIPLNTQRLTAVADELKECEVKSVIDLGCGEGKLTQLLLHNKQLEHITDVDVSPLVLERAKSRLHYDEMNEHQQARLNFFQGSITYRDERFKGFDAACLVEVIEHQDPSRLDAVADVVFGDAAPRIVIVSTPNREYNVNYPFLADGKLRHPDHRFEWTREEFQDWSKRVASQYGYTVEFRPIGEDGSAHGSPTQMGVFTK